MSVVAVATTATAVTTVASSLYKTVADLLKKGNTVATNIHDAGNISLTQYTKPLRMCSRVYIDASVSEDPIITEILKTVHTQYAGLILTALQMNQYVTRDRDVASMLKVVATESNKIHEEVVETLFSAVSNGGSVSPPLPIPGQLSKKEQEEAEKKARELAEAERRERLKKPVNQHNSGPGGNGSMPVGKIVSFAGDNHIPAGKILEITLTNPENKDASVTLNLLVQLAPYIVPELIAIQFITKDIIPSFFQRYLQWRSGEISFLSDLIAMSDIAKRRAQIAKMDPTGIIGDVISKQSKSRFKTFENISKDPANRARNIANSVLVFNIETVKRAKAESGVDFTNPKSRQTYFNSSYAMIIVVVDMLYHQVTFYYNGIDDAATFSFDQVRTPTKGGQGLDLMAVMSAFNQGRSPKF